MDKVLGSERSMPWGTLVGRTNSVSVIQAIRSKDQRIEPERALITSEVV